MVSRILTFISCTLHFCILCTLTIIGLTSIIIGFVGLGLYIPTLINYNAYNQNICHILDHEYDTCHRPNDLSCYSVMWSVEYIVSNRSVQRDMFSTITKFYETPIEALNQLGMYKDQNNYTCYYHKTRISNVTWDKPSSPIPYLIMIVIGFILTGIFFTIIGVIAMCRCRKTVVSIDLDVFRSMKCDVPISINYNLK